MSNQVHALDLFAGCGGLSLGMQQCGVQIIGAIEKDKWAAETYAANHSSVKILNTGVEEIGDKEIKRLFAGVTMIAGGPPCQGFSVSGKRQFGIYKKDNWLLREYIRYVKILRPKCFIVENVRGLVTATIEGKTSALSLLMSELEDLGYIVHHQVLQAHDFGVPQYRSRVFVIGTLAPVRNAFPETTTKQSGKISVMEAIGDLPYLVAGTGSESAVPYTTPAKTNYQREMRFGSIGVLNHVAMKHTQRLIERFEHIEPGGKGYDIGRSNRMKTVTVYKSNNQRLVSDLPSLCITANFQSTYVHPKLNRNLTAREAARIQTFPDRFIFKGKRTLMSSTLLRAEGREGENFLSQYNQIGNAVPPRFAKVIVSNLVKEISR